MPPPLALLELNVDNAKFVMIQEFKKNNTENFYDYIFISLENAPGGVYMHMIMSAVL